MSEAIEDQVDIPDTGGDELAGEIEEATEEVCRYQQQRELAWLKVAKLKDDAKVATDAAKEIDEMFHHAAKRLRKLREGRYPDGDRHPLFDRDADKQAINDSFPPAEAVTDSPTEGGDDA